MPPLVPGDEGPRPLTANEWADPNFPIPGYPVVNGPPMPGDIGANYNPNGHGHVGIMTGGGTNIAAPSGGPVSGNNVQFNSGTFRRPIGP